MEDTLRSYHRPEETMWDLELDPAKEKEHQQETLSKASTLVNSVV